MTTQSTAAPHRQLLARAYRQCGYFTAAQAVQAGVSHQTLKYHCDRGDWPRAQRGIYRLADWPDTIEDVYVLWTLWSRGQGVISHTTALAIHDFGTANPPKVSMTVPAGFAAQTPTVVVTFVADLPDSDVEQRSGYRITSPLRTLLDAAAGETRETIDDAITDALAVDAVTPEALRRRAEEFGDRAALRIERALVAHRENLSPRGAATPLA